MEDDELLLKGVFGESSDSDTEDREQQHQQQQKLEGDRLSEIQNSSWQRIKEIKGLCLCRDFLSLGEQSCLLSAIQNEGWFTDASHNQVMRFGDLPTWAIKLSDSIREEALLGDLAINDGDEEVCILPSNLLWREPLFDQLIVNIYQPGEGICPHIDLMRFEDGIAILSLESSCVMHFTRAKESFATGEGGKEDSPAAAKIPIYMNPGSLVIMSGEARYLWKHEINRQPGFQIWEGKELNQKRRISITLRKLCHVE